MLISVRVNFRLRLGIRLLYGVRGASQWLEIWLGGSSMQSPRYSRSDNCTYIYKDNYQSPVGNALIQLVKKREIKGMLSVAIGGSKGGGARDARPPSQSKFFQFHAVLGKIGKNNRLVPPPL